MPKMIGHTEIPCATVIDDRPADISKWVRVKYATACAVCAVYTGAIVYRELDNTDRGYRGVLAKRWYRWYMRDSAIRIARENNVIK